jgi:hypothetical protein
VRCRSSVRCRGMTAVVGTITGAYGAALITVGGLPIYNFAKAGVPGETKGQLAKDMWHVVTPSGQKVG